MIHSFHKKDIAFVSVQEVFSSKKSDRKSALSALGTDFLLKLYRPIVVSGHFLNVYSSGDVDFHRSGTRAFIDLVTQTPRRGVSHFSRGQTLEPQDINSLEKS